ncbi:hypothetical protein HanRHA438_Chr17g0799421 [Helianthus annuus]|nr:hypothetical protein HanRHA438_Chr17g0799421 [Helianthus annuus]
MGRAEFVHHDGFQLFPSQLISCIIPAFVSFGVHQSKARDWKTSVAFRVQRFAGQPL